MPKLEIYFINSEWVVSLVPVKNNNGDIRLCVDFGNMNKHSLKDNYSLPEIDHILQKVVGSTRISMMDRFSGYSKILK